MDHSDFERASTYWTRKDAARGEAAIMGQAELRAEIEEFLSSNGTCALATGSGEHARCTPVEYSYHDGALWIFSEGGLKFANLEVNPHVGVAVFRNYEGFGRLRSVQIEGVADVLLPGEVEYAAAAAFKRIPMETLEKLPEPMYLIKISPACADYLCSDLKERGFSSRQHLVWS